MSRKPEQDLITACKRGNQEAIGELFERYYPSSLRVARGILRSEAESQDAVQAAYLSAFRHLHRFREDSAFKTWITRIVVNCCLMQLRERSYRVRWVHLKDIEQTAGAFVLKSPTPSPEQTASSRELASAHNRALAKLPLRWREVYLLRDVSGLSLREAAKELGVTVAAAKTRLFRARARMRCLLRPVWITRRVAA
jgi:RNA polymerase sigma-70 factor (ECF subfamily)